MILADRLRSRRTVMPALRRVTRPPVTLAGPFLLVARACWIAMALTALAVWLLEAPLLYRAALHLQNTDGMFTLSSAGWRLGLHRLGLSPTVYAVHAVGLLFVMSSVMFLIGLLIFVRRSNEWLALLVSYAFVTVGVGIITAYAGGPALLKAHPAWSGPLTVYTDLADLGWGGLFLIPLVFPDGRFVPRWTGWLALIGFIPFILPTNTIPSPVWISGPFTVLWFGTVLLSPIYRYRRISDRGQREQTKWVMFGLVVALGMFLAMGLIQTFIPGFTGKPERIVLLDLIGGTLVYVGFTFLPITFAVAILRYRLWDIDLIINRSLVYAGLSIGVVGLYVAIVVGLGALVGSRGNIVLSLLAAALVAVLFAPLRERLQRGANRLMYGDRDDPYAVVSQLGRQLENTLVPGAVLPMIVETIAQALKLPYAAIASRDEAGFTVAAAVGTPADEPLTVALIYGGETVGQLILSTRYGEATFSDSDRRLLDDLARQAGVAVSAVRLTDDLQRSRQRLVTAREEERRRLRRDLHDGLGPELAAMAMQSEAARDLLRTDPVQTDALLAELTDQLQAATSDIRRLVHDLRPPALDDFGLVGAVRNGMTRYERGLRLTLEAPPALPTLPAAVEVAAYRIILEALHNVVRHAAAQTCRVRLAVDEPAGMLEIEIRDDGRGMQPGRQAGVGLASMRERAAELGGVCEIEWEQGAGTRIHAALPVALDQPNRGMAGTP
jgi:signal transduction histidine kinase